MKKKIVLMAFLAGAFVQQTFAQKGGILLYGDFGFMSSTSKNEYNTGFGTLSSKTTTTTGIFAPGIGYALNDNFIIGLNIGFSSETVKPEDGDKLKSSQFAVGPFARYTKKLGDIFSIYGQADLSYLGGKEEEFDTYGTTTYKTSGVGFRVGPNIGIDIGKGWGLDFGYGALSFSSIKQTNEDDDNEENTNTNFGLELTGSSVRVGVSYMFNCGKKE